MIATTGCAWIVAGCATAPMASREPEAVGTRDKIFEQSANQIVPVGNIPISPTKMEGIGLPYWRPDYQKKFYSASHTSPTEESKRAAIRQMEEIAKTIGIAPTPEEISRLQLPDGRFTGSRMWSTQPIIWDYENNSDILLVTSIYAYPYFLDAQGKAVKNPNSEHLYILRGETKVRRAKQSELRTHKLDRGRILVFPGSKYYERGKPEPNYHQ